MCEKCRYSASRHVAVTLYMLFDKALLILELWIFLHNKYLINIWSPSWCAAAPRVVQQGALEGLSASPAQPRIPCGGAPSCAVRPCVVFVSWRMKVRAWTYRTNEESRQPAQRRHIPAASVSRRQTMKSRCVAPSDLPEDAWVRRQNGGGSEGTCGPSEYFFGEYCQTIER